MTVNKDKRQRDKTDNVEEEDHAKAEAFIEGDLTLIMHPKKNQNYQRVEVVYQRDDQVRLEQFFTQFLASQEQTRVQLNELSAGMTKLLRIHGMHVPNSRRDHIIFKETKGNSSSNKDDEYNDEDCRSKECIDLIECNDGHIFDINKPLVFYDNDDVIVEEKVVLGNDGRVLEVTQLTSIPQVLVVVLCDEAPSMKIRDFWDEVEEITPRIYVSTVVDGLVIEVIL
ncbi:hypothetical protein Sjap_021697 [Stephania japonica]|uniref:Uncharacterized protein n=1 Tax=Stephania japonica TaxID=461633 RepID=A0AAP0EQ24_9MAGN